MYEFQFSKDFKKDLKKLTKQEQKKVLITLDRLKVNPYHPSLRTKKFHASGRDIYECSVNMDIRILFRFEGNTIIVLLDIGHHDILDNF